MEQGRDPCAEACRGNRGQLNSSTRKYGRRSQFGRFLLSVRHVTRRRSGGAEGVTGGTISYSATAASRDICQEHTSLGMRLFTSSIPVSPLSKDKVRRWACQNRNLPLSKDSIKITPPSSESTSNTRIAQRRPNTLICISRTTLSLKPSSQRNDRSRWTATPYTLYLRIKDVALALGVFADSSGKSQAASIHLRQQRSEI
jgi:hypothetical protein